MEEERDLLLLLLPSANATRRWGAARRDTFPSDLLPSGRRSRARPKNQNEALQSLHQKSNSVCMFTGKRRHQLTSDAQIGGNWFTGGRPYFKAATEIYLHDYDYSMPDCYQMITLHLTLEFWPENSSNWWESIEISLGCTRREERPIYDGNIYSASLFIGAVYICIGKFKAL